MNDIKDYAFDQQLEMKWKLALDNHKAFEDILSDIKADLDKTVRAAQPKDLMKIQQRASDLKMQIEDSEVFSKYLVHKEMTRLRFRDADKDNELLICKTARIISQAKTEEEKTMIRNRFEKVRHLLVPEPEVNQELEDFKLKHDAEIEDLKRSHSQLVDEITSKHSKEIEEIKNKHNEEVKEITNKHSEEDERIKKMHSKEVEKITNKHSDDVEKIKKIHTEDIEKINYNHSEEVKEITNKHNDKVEETKNKHNEEIKKITNKHFKEAEKIKKIHEEERVKDSKEKENLLNQRIEVEQEFKKISDQYTELKEGPQRLSYEVKLNIILKMYTKQYYNYEYHFFFSF